MNQEELNDVSRYLFTPVYYDMDTMKQIAKTHRDMAIARGEDFTDTVRCAKCHNRFDRYDMIAVPQPNQDRPNRKIYFCHTCFKTRHPQWMKRHNGGNV